MDSTSPVAAESKPVWLAVILLAALGLRLGWGLRQSTDVGALDSLPDQQEYLQLGKNLLAGEGLQFTDPRFGQRVWAYRTPGYPLLVAACGADLRTIRIVQAFLDTSTVAAIFLLARRWLSPNQSLVAALLVAIDPMLIYFSGLVLSETLFIAMLAWGMALLSHVGRHVKHYTLKGAIILALSVLVRPSALLIGPILMVAMKPKSGLRLAAALAGLTLLVLFPWAWRNHERLGVWVWTSTNSGITQYDGFNPRATGASDQTFLRDMPQVKPMGEIERSQYLGALANQFIREHPWQCVELAISKIGRLWSPIPLSAQFGRPLYVAAEVAYATPLFVLAVLGLAGRGLPARAKVLLLVPALYFTVVHAASVGGLRYRLPCEPPLAILAAAAFVGRDRRAQGDITQQVAH